MLAADAAMYETTMYGASPLSHAEREFLAFTVSRLNRCEPCSRHHSGRYAQLAAFAEVLTRDADRIREEISVDCGEPVSMIARFSMRATSSPASTMPIA
ncbi:MAG: carboxymuconolactone decarboxylase family protein [Gemmatimonadales bacterium]|nr:carboxymuconolactone decarboxylase family protein [Gemmatimonadales bacterium]